MFKNYEENAAWLVECLCQYLRERQEVGVIERVAGKVYFALDKERRVTRNIMTLLEIDS